MTPPKITPAPPPIPPSPPIKEVETEAKTISQNRLPTPSPVASPKSAVQKVAYFHGGLPTLWKFPLALDVNQSQELRTSNPNVPINKLLILFDPKYAQAHYKLAMSGLKDPDPWVRGEAIAQLGELGFYAQKAAPELKELLNDLSLSVRIEAAIALIKIGGGKEKDAPLILNRLLVSLNDQTLALCLRWIKAIDLLPKPLAKEALPRLRTLLLDTDPQIRREAAFTLASLSSPQGPNAQNADELIPHLTIGLKSQDAEIRIRAALALGFLGSGARKAMPDLKAALKNESNSDVQAEYLVAMQRIGPLVPELISTFIQFLQDPNDSRKAAAIHALGDYGAQAKDAVPELFNLLPTLDWRFGGNVAHARMLYGIADAIGKIVSEDPSMLSHVLTALESKDQGTQLGALYALPKIGPAAKAAIPFLIKLDQKLEQNFRFWTNRIYRNGIDAALEAMGASAQSEMGVGEEKTPEDGS